MAASFSDHNKKLTLCLLILVSLGIVDLYAQSASAHKNISGNINNLKSFNRTYSSTQVVTIGADRVTVGDATNFAPGDTVLLIQMQGVGILVPDDNSYGNYQTSFGKPGAYEFLIVTSVAPPEIVFRNNIINPYDVIGKIQLVRVPYFNSATVKSKLFCDAWDGSRGGVLALILGRSLTLEADIDLSGLGFRGGLNNHAADGLCQEAGSKTKGFFYGITFYNAGIKGEGNSIHDKDGNALLPDKERGQGPNYTGGGGGNGKFSGGGGGANRGFGGVGGTEEGSSCSPIPGPGGKGGLSATYTTLLTRIFAGGGGGASTSVTGTGGQGGNGGGIVIIVTDTIQSKGGKILVDGNKGADGSATGGAGGGGAGGSIAISLMSYGPASNPLVLSAKGGNGGINPASFGEGGGGGGGLIFLSKAVAANVTSPLSGGSSTGGTDGTAGEKKEDFTAVLNGFLFNSIRSLVTGNDKDSICSDTAPPALTGTTPIGGTGPYTYKWEKSNNKIAWSDLFISTKDYTPPAPEATTVYYRRTITDSSVPTVLVDVSKEVEIKVQPFIKGNTIGSDATICYNQDQIPLISAATLTDGNGIYKFHWQLSMNNGSTYTDPSSNIAESYDPPVLTDTIRPYLYRRIVTSGRCLNTSPPVSIVVLPPIHNNSILNSPPVICNGMLFDNLVARIPAVLKGGDNTFRYKWEGNINNAGWSDAPGTFNQPDYNPVELAQRVPYNEYRFRRVVKSGTGDVCSNTSSEVLLKDYPVIANNIISSPQTICSGSSPAKLTGLTPANGDGTYKYTWQDSTKIRNSGAWTDIPGFINSGSIDYSPPILTDTIRYRRIVTSSACTKTSKSVIIVVHKPLANTAISLLSGLTDTTICNGQNPAALKGNLATGGTNIPGDFAYQWKSSSGINGTYNAIPSATFTGYDPPALTASTYYKRQVVSGACTVESSPVTINVLALISGNTFQDQTICYNTAPAQLIANVIGGDGSYTYKWEQSTDGGATWTNSATSATFAPPALTDTLRYRRTVKSGLADCCSSVSNIVTIKLHPALPTGKIVNTGDTTIFSTTPVLLNVNLTGTGPWKVTLSENSAAGASYDITNTTSVISLVPETAAGLSSFEYGISKVEDAFGCLATSITGSKTVIIFNEAMFEFPEGFSPNGDSFNNTYDIKGLDLQNLQAELSIVNSAGTEVFRTSNNPGQTWTNWDGKNSKGADLPDGTYFYLVKVSFPDSSVFRKSGFVILKRY